MRRCPVLILCLVALSAVATAHPVLDRIAADLDTGLITEAEASLHELRYVFAADQLPERYRVAGAPPLACATPVLIRADSRRPRMTAAQRTQLDALMPRPAADKADETYISPSGRFRLDYDTSGDARVPNTDVAPRNGIPDFIENCAAYFDSTWVALAEVHGFAAPVHPDDTYQITFENMDGALGYATGVQGPQGSTRIAILNNLEGLSWSVQFPDVTADDIARMVCCHELKHASQAATSLWTEGDWVELDATWSQDIVFDHENDYRRYLGGQSVGPSCLSHPHISLDDRDEVAGLYEEMLWEIWMSETWGVGFVQEIWERRRRHSTEEMLTTYDVVLQTRGSSIEDGFPVFSGWNFLSGNRSVSNLGYADAATYPPVPVDGVVALFPSDRSGTTDHLAAVHTLVAGLPDEGWLEIAFDGEDGRTLACVVAVRNLDGTGSLHTVPLDAAGDGMLQVPVPLDLVDNMGVTVANPSLDQDDSTWTFTVSIVAPPPFEVAQSELGLEVEAGLTGTTALALSVPADGADILWSVRTEAGGMTVPWLAIDPASGTLAAGADLALEVTASTDGLAPGIVQADIVLTFATDGPLADAGLEFHRRIPIEVTVTPSGNGLHITSLGPNPTRSEINVGWAGAKAGETAILTVHDLRGRTLRQTTVDVLSVGATEWMWDGLDQEGRSVASGRYLLRVSTSTGTAVGSFVLVR